MRIDSSGNVTINSSGTIPTGVLLGKQLVVSSSTGAEIIAFREDTSVEVGDKVGAFLIGNSDIDGIEDHFVGMWGKASSTNGPENCAGSPFGYQWFPIPWIDGSSEEESSRGMQQAVEDLNAFLDALMVDEDLLPEQVCLFGFSQGTMMSLHVAPRREDPVAGIVAFSGRLLEPELLADEVQSRMPILLVHGDQDDVVPVQSLPQAAEALQNAGFSDVYAHVMKGTAHGIAPDGLSVALAFIRDQLGF